MSGPATSCPHPAYLPRVIGGHSERISPWMYDDIMIYNELFGMIWLCLYISNLLAILSRRGPPSCSWIFQTQPPMLPWSSTTSLRKNKLRLVAEPAAVNSSVSRCAVFRQHVQLIWPGACAAFRVLSNESHLSGLQSLEQK